MSDQRFCPTCKQLNNMMATECIHCGAPLPSPTEGFRSSTIKVSSTEPISTPPQPGVIAGLDANTFALVVVDKEPVILSECKEVILGRKSQTSNLLNLIDLTPYGAQDLGVSRKHLKITPKEQGQSFTVQDLASTNGSWLNGARLVPVREYLLRNGDLLRLGKLPMHFHCHSPNNQE